MARVVKAFGQRSSTRSSASTRENEDLYQRYLESTRAAALNAPLLNFISNVCTLVMLWVGGMLVIWTNQLTFGELVGVLRLPAAARPAGPPGRLADDDGRRARRPPPSASSKSSTRRSASSSPPDAIELPPSRGAVEFQDVTCAYYPGRPVLQHVSFMRRARPDDRPGRRDRLGQDDHRQPDPALLRRRRRPGARRRPRRARRRPRLAAPADRHRHAGDDAVLRHHPREHRLRPSRRHRRRDRLGRPRRPRRRVHRAPAARATTRSSASAASRSRAARSSASPSPARC